MRSVDTAEDLMPDSTAGGLCALLADGIRQFRQEIVASEAKAEALRALIDRLTGRAGPGDATVEQLRAQLAEIERKIDSDQASMRALEEESTFVGCPPITDA
jgi:chromosome segregation ATPase